MSRGGSMPEERSDAELLTAMRSGERHAYEALWQRHFDSGLRYARRLLPSRAEDLVSESFLSIYQQVGVAGKGPESMFRAYLKTVIRNTAVQWRRDAARLIDTDDLEPVDHRDGLSRLERKAESAEILATFGELPDRWQRVLWLSEVEEAARSTIARELGIRPNAVSALQSRARSGMKLRWLSRQVPSALRDDVAHVARLLPRHLSDPADAALATQVAAHVVGCIDCGDLLRAMRGSVTRVQGGALSTVLLGALGAGLPVAASLSTTTATAAVVTAAGSGLAAWAIGAGLAAATAGGLVLTSLFTVSAPPALPAAELSPAPVRVPAEVPLPGAPIVPPLGVGAPAPPAAPSGGTDAGAGAEPEPEVGAGAADPLAAATGSGLDAGVSILGVQATVSAAPAAPAPEASLVVTGPLATTLSVGVDAPNLLAPSPTVAGITVGIGAGGSPTGGCSASGSAGTGSVLAALSGACSGLTAALGIGAP